MTETPPVIARHEQADLPLYFEVMTWLHREAELLDTLREAEWLETMIAEDIVYQMPVRQTVMRSSGDGFFDHAFHLDETYGSLATRIARTKTAFAWGEDPPSRSRHFVTNIRVKHGDDGLIEATSSLLLFRSRADQSIGNTISCERRDVLRRDGGALRLIKRTVLLDVSVVETHNLAVIF
jgi:ethylbenzene dioxygenase beta subunit